jgi:hypothetical protein
MKKVLALSGFKQSGKDTAAQYLQEFHSFERVAFADPLKDMTALEYGVSRADMDNPNRKEMPISHLPVSPKDDFSLYLSRFLCKEFRTINGHRPFDYFVDRSGAFLGLVSDSHGEQLYWTPRALCILKGSVNRTVTSDYWMTMLIKKIEDSPNEYHVISDLRYRSEISQLQEHFGKNLTTVRINRFDSIDSSDPSENDLTNHKFDVILENKGTVEDFKDTLRDFAIDFRKL